MSLGWPRPDPSWPGPSRHPRMPNPKSRTTRRTGRTSRARPAGRKQKARGRSTRKGSAYRTRIRTTPRTGARRAARLRRTLDERPKGMPVEFEDLGPDGLQDNSKEARDRRADSRRLRLDHPELHAPRDE
jgi:hypothetical protein